MARALLAELPQVSPSPKHLARATGSRPMAIRIAILAIYMLGLMFGKETAKEIVVKIQCIKGDDENA